RDSGGVLLELCADTAGGKAQGARVNMGAPIFAPARIPPLLPGEPPIDVAMTVEGHRLAVTAISMGNPHAVISVDDAAAFPLETLGPRIEHHPSFPRRGDLPLLQVPRPPAGAVGAGGGGPRAT